MRKDGSLCPMHGNHSVLILIKKNRNRIMHHIRDDYKINEINRSMIPHGSKIRALSPEANSIAMCRWADRTRLLWLDTTPPSLAALLKIHSPSSWFSVQHTLEIAISRSIEWRADAWDFHAQLFIWPQTIEIAYVACITASRLLLQTCRAD